MCYVAVCVATDAYMLYAGLCGSTGIKCVAVFVAVCSVAACSVVVCCVAVYCIAVRVAVDTYTLWAESMRADK